MLDIINTQRPPFSHPEKKELQPLCWCRLRRLYLMFPSLNQIGEKGIEGSNNGSVFHCVPAKVGQKHGSISHE